MSKEKTKTELQTELDAANAKVAEGEEAALKRVCEALKIDPKDLEAKDVVPVKEDQIQCFVSYPVNINGTVYRGKVTVSKSTFEVLQQAMGDRKMRLLRETVGSNYQLQAILEGGFAPKLVGQYDSSGERIA